MVAYRTSVTFLINMWATIQVLIKEIIKYVDCKGIVLPLFSTLLMLLIQMPFALYTPGSVATLILKIENGLNKHHFYH